MRVYIFFLNHKFPKLGIVSASKLQYVYVYLRKHQQILFISLLAVNIYDMKLRVCFGFSGHLQGVQGPKGQKGEPYIIAPEIISQYRVCLQLPPVIPVQYSFSGT